MEFFASVQVICLPMKRVASLAPEEIKTAVCYSSALLLERERRTVARYLAQR